MSQSTSLEFEAPWPVYGMDWCRTWTPGQARARAAFRLAIASYTEDYRNRLAVIGLQDERVLLDDEIHEGYSDFVVLAETMHGYPATKLQWQPHSASTFNWATKNTAVELLATTGDALRIWDLSYDGDPKVSNYVGSRPTGTGYHLQQKVALSGSKAPSSTSTPPLTSFSWNSVKPSHLVTSSIDTTCTVWDINTSAAITQLIAHDREVYDVAWLPTSTDVFTSVGADGSLRLFDLRSLEHSTILYEASTVRAKETSKTASPQTRPPSSPLLRIAFNPLDSHYIATFHADAHEVQILDMRSPGAPIIEIKCHKAPINAVGWSKQDNMLATASDDSQVLIWDLSPQAISSPRHLHHTSTARAAPSPRPDKKRIITDPILSYSATGEVNNIAWSPVLPQMAVPGSGVIAGGEWLALASSKTIRMLKV